MVLHSAPALTSLLAHADLCNRRQGACQRLHCGGFLQNMIPPKNCGCICSLVCISVTSISPDCGLPFIYLCGAFRQVVWRLNMHLTETHIPFNSFNVNRSPRHTRSSLFVVRVYTILPSVTLFGGLEVKEFWLAVCRQLRGCFVFRSYELQF